MYCSDIGRMSAGEVGTESERHSVDVATDVVRHFVSVNERAPRSCGGFVRCGAGLATGPITRTAPGDALITTVTPSMSEAWVAARKANWCSHSTDLTSGMTYTYQG